MEVKKFRNIVETQVENIFNEKETKENIRKRVNLKIPKYLINFYNYRYLFTILLSLPFLIIAILCYMFCSEGSQFILSVIFFVLTGWVGFVTVFIIPKHILKRIGTHVARNLDQKELFKLTLDKIKNVDIHQFAPSTSIEGYIWNYGNMIDVVRTTVNVKKRETIYSGGGARIIQYSNVLKGSINDNNFSLFFPKWKWTTGSGKHQTTHKRTYAVLKIENKEKIINSELFINDKHSAKAFSINEDKLENKNFNTKFKVYAEKITSRKLFTLYNQELWSKLSSAKQYKKSKVAISENTFLQCFDVRDFDEKILLIDLKRMKSIKEEYIIDKLYEDVKSDLNDILWSLSFFATLRQSTK